jgi:hypothetical protein
VKRASSCRNPWCRQPFVTNRGLVAKLPDLLRKT